MDWFREVNNYCERTDASYWSEPLNALSNLSFLIAALFCWRYLRGRRDPGARLLVLVLAMIGIGSYLFHTHAQIWAMWADVLPILGFIMIYIYLATRRFFHAPVWVGLAASAAWVPLSAWLSAGIAAVVGPLNGSVGYLPVAILIAIFALALARRRPDTAVGLAIGAALFSASLVFRSIDEMACAANPLGTHFLWHALNGLLLGWMIVVLVRHAEPAGLAKAAARG